MACEDECGKLNSAEVLRSICRRICSIDEKTPSPPEPDPHQNLGVLSLVLIIFGIAAVIFFLAVTNYYYLEGRNYSISFEDDAFTFSDGGSIAMILKGNVISFYGDPPLNLRSTDFTDGSSQPFGAARLTFTNIFSSTNHVDYSVSIAVDPFERGRFNGWMQITTEGGSTIFSPMSVTSGAYIVTPMLLVLTGVCVSICLWEIVRYFKFKSDSAKKNEYENKRQALENPLRAASLANGRNRSLGDIRVELRNSDPTYRTIEPRIQQYQRSIDAYVRRGQQRDWTLFKIIIIEFFSALFGVAVGLVVTYNDIITSNYLVIDLQKAILLFSIGLGAGSLKELADK